MHTCKAGHLLRTTDPKACPEQQSSLSYPAGVPECLRSLQYLGQTLFFT